jgi:hypothetical protein
MKRSAVCYDFQNCNLNIKWGLAAATCVVCYTIWQQICYIKWQVCRQLAHSCAEYHLEAISLTSYFMKIHMFWYMCCVDGCAFCDVAMAPWSCNTRATAHPAAQHRILLFYTHVPADCQRAHSMVLQMEELFVMVTKLPTAVSWSCSKQFVPL